MTNGELKSLSSRTHRGFVSSFDIRASSFRGKDAFTLLELLIVISIIIILAGLTIATMSYVQTKARRSRAEAEIAAFSAALENYKADNGVYPSDPASTETLAANSDPDGGDPAKFVASCQFLYKKITGDSDGNPTTSDATNDTKNYLGNGLRPNMLYPNPPGPNTYIQDPFRYSYGYSTIKAANSASGNGYNPTFDLWSTCGETGKRTNPPETFQQYQMRWIKNW
jgi:prepilin-type N-terminal cleavage/methylation domain-containing protein